MDGNPGRLVVNVDASAGWLRVQVRDANSGTVIEGLSFADCTPITGDGLQMEVRWGSKEHTLQKLANLAGQAVKLEFELINAGLFAFEFVDL
jgi:hypothetical protein